MRGCSSRVRYSRTLILFILFLLICIFVFGISYHGFRKLLFPHDLKKNGILQSKAAADIRSDLILNHGGREVRFKSKDGVDLAGLIFIRPNARANMIISHGYFGRKESYHRMIKMFSDFNILLFDFRAHGQSKGDFTTIGYLESNDVIGAVEYIKDKNNLISGLPLILLGASMGGAAILRAHEKNQNLCDALIIDSTYADLGKEMAFAFCLESGLPKYPFFPIITMMGNWYSGCDISNVRPAEYIKKIKIPVLLIHSCVDEIIPPADSLEIYKNGLLAGAKIKLWIAPPCKHPKLHAEYPDLYYKNVSRFLRKHNVCNI